MKGILLIYENPRGYLTLVSDSYTEENFDISPQK